MNFDQIKKITKFCSKKQDILRAQRTVQGFCKKNKPHHNQPSPTINDYITAPLLTKFLPIFGHLDSVKWTSLKIQKIEVNFIFYLWVPPFSPDHFNLMFWMERKINEIQKKFQDMFSLPFLSVV